MPVFPLDASRYHIGNSLTVDATTLRPSGTGPYGRHVNCSNNLVDIWNNPTQVCVTPIPDLYTPSFASDDWDIMILQPHRGDTAVDQANVVPNFIALEPGAHVFIYEPWGRLAEDMPIWDTNTALTETSQNFYSDLRARLDVLGVTYSRIPVGDIFFVLGNDVSLASLYRDNIHASVVDGRGIAAQATHFAIHRELSPDINITNPIFNTRIVEVFNSIGVFALNDYEVF